MTEPFQSNCPILEVTGDGVPCGRCWYYSPEGICPRHGDVTKELEVYRIDGKLTLETERNA